MQRFHDSPPKLWVLASFGELSHAKYMIVRQSSEVFDTQWNSLRAKKSSTPAPMFWYWKLVLNAGHLHTFTLSHWKDSPAGAACLRNVAAMLRDKAKRGNVSIDGKALGGGALDNRAPIWYNT